MFVLFQDPRCNSSWEIFDQNNLLKEKKNGQIMGILNRMMLILSYTIQVVVPNVCNKFLSPRCSSSWEIYDMEWEMEKRKKKKKKKAK